MFFYIVIVIYNQKISDSVLFKNELEYCKILVVDNSTKIDVKEDNKYFCSKKKCSYIDMNGNAGLSKAYNKAISFLNLKKDDWILFLDQDTIVDKSFIDKYTDSISKNPEKLIFCPVIKDDVGIMSPALIKGKGFSHSMICDYNKAIGDYSFINSGMCINSSIFEKVKYDENLFLDMVDHDFVMSVKRVFNDNIFYVITNMLFFQSFSGVTRNALKSDEMRFSILKKDQTYFYKKHFRNTFYSNFRLLLRAIKLCLNHRTLLFFRILNNKDNMDI